MGEWKEYKLGDVCSIIGRIGFRGYTTEDLTSNPKDGAISLSPTNIVEGELDLSKPTYIKWPKYYESPEIMLEQGDIVLVKTGSSIGRTTRIREIKHPMTLNPQFVVLKKIKVDSVFLSYIIKSPYFQASLRTITVGSAIPTLSQKNLAKLTINLPNIQVQKEIASILSSLDDKIEVNRRINENLEQQAQALFKSWFVDFEPFKDGEFVESELGMIPEGWRVLEAQDVFDINIGKTPPRKEQKWFTKNNEDNIWVSIADMGSCGMFISDSSEYLTNEAIERFNIQMVEKDSLLLSFKLTVGRVAIAGTRLTTNEAIARFILPNEYYREFLYLYLKQYKYGNLGSTSSIATAVNSKTIKRMKLLIPSSIIISDFSKNIKPLFDKIEVLSKESRRLASLRDTLLPRLMSGELKVNEIETKNEE